MDLILSEMIEKVNVSELYPGIRIEWLVCILLAIIFMHFLFIGCIVFLCKLQFVHLLTYLSMSLFVLMLTIGSMFMFETFDIFKVSIILLFAYGIVLSIWSFTRISGNKKAAHSL